MPPPSPSLVFVSVTSAGRSIHGVHVGQLTVLSEVDANHSSISAY